MHNLTILTVTDFNRYHYFLWPLFVGQTYERFLFPAVCRFISVEPSFKRNYNFVCVCHWYETFECLWNSHFITLQLITVSLFHPFSIFLSLSLLHMYVWANGFFLQSPSIMRTTHDRVCPNSQLTARSACAVKVCPSSALSVSTPLLIAALAFI